uniref:hypothetical protein n=1 Tax=Roseivirga sp. TaxID=1964215 RepID=UPI004047594C
MIKYSWAKYENRPIHISEVDLNMRKEGAFFNIVTNERMTAYLEGKFRPHFHHISENSVSYETYLHQVAKEVFQETYLNALSNKSPFYMEYYVNAKCNLHSKITDIICDFGVIIEKFDLTEVFDLIHIEKNYEQFRPDIRLSSTKNNEVLFIEIQVKHKSTEKKLNSGNRIIEIKIENDLDIQKLRQKSIKVNQSKVKFYNFKEKTTIGGYCSANEKGCRTVKNIFFQKNDGTYEFMKDTIENIITHIYSNESLIEHYDFTIDNIYSYSESKFESKIQYLKRKKIAIRDCGSCRYIATNKWLYKSGTVKNELFCKFKKKVVEPDKGFSCKYFRPPKTTNEG